jgi:hypothetical protein
VNHLRNKPVWPQSNGQEGLSKSEGEVNHRYSTSRERSKRNFALTSPCVFIVKLFGREPLANHNLQLALDKGQDFFLLRCQIRLV